MASSPTSPDPQGLLRQGLAPALCGLCASEEGRGLEASPSPTPCLPHTSSHSPHRAAPLTLALKSPRGCMTQRPCFVSLSDRSRLSLCHYCCPCPHTGTLQIAALVKEWEGRVWVRAPICCGWPGDLGKPHPSGP